MLECFSQKFKRFNWESRTKRLMFYVKLGVIFCLLVSGLSNSVTGWAVQQVEVSCIEDQGFQIFSSFNLFFRSNPDKLLLLISITAFTCDLLLLFSVFRQITCSQSVKPTLALILVFLVYLFARQFFWMQVPEGRCWEDPLWPSFIFAFHESPDFFFATSTAAVFVFIAENRACKNFGLLALALLAMGLVWVTTLITRVDYSVGLLTGVMVGHYAWIVAGYVEEKLPGWTRVRDEEGREEGGWVMMENFEGKAK